MNGDDDTVVQAAVTALDPNQAAALFYAGHALAYVSAPNTQFACGQWMGQQFYITNPPFPFDNAAAYFTANPVILASAVLPLPPQPPQPITPANVIAPIVTGSGSVGATLSCGTGSWQNAPTGFTYQWKKIQGGSTIIFTGQTSSTYVPPSTERGHDVFCTVTASNAAGSASADSNHVTIVN